MRSTISIARRLASVGSYVVGSEAIAILTSIASISAVEVAKQYLDDASLSYETSARRQSFARIDHLLDARGLHRI